MTTRLIDDQATRNRLARLLAFWQRKSYECQQHAQECHDRGDVWGCEAAQRQVQDADTRASKVARCMVFESGTPAPLGLADVLAKLPDARLAQIAPTGPVELPPLHLTPASPGTLVELVRWLRSRWGQLLPGLTTETWQTIACAVLLRREGGAR